jgi:hypothetical protein
MDVLVGTLSTMSRTRPRSRAQLVGNLTRSLIEAQALVDVGAGARCSAWLQARNGRFRGCVVSGAPLSVRFPNGFAFDEAKAIVPRCSLPARTGVR